MEVSVMKRLSPFIPAVLLLAAFGSFVGAASVRASSPPAQQTINTRLTPAATPEPSESPEPVGPSGAAPAEAPDPETTQPAPAAGTTDAGHADNPADSNADHQFEGQE
jgi:hypothetical protein